MIAEPFEEMLERCLQEVMRTGDVDVVVQQHPQHAEQLRPLLETALLTSRYYSTPPEPPPGGLAAGRTRLLALASQQRERTHAAPTPSYRRQKMKLVFATKLVSAILAAVMGATAVGGGIAWAAGDSLPGDVLYPAKLTIENVQLALASTPQAKVNLNLQFGEERVAEILALVEAGSPVAEPVVTRMEQQFRRALEEAQQASEQERARLMEQIAQRVQTQAQLLERAHTSTPEETQARLQQAQRVCLQVHEAVQAALGEMNQERNRNNAPEEPGPIEPPSGNPTSTPEGEQHQEQQQEQQREQEQQQEQNQQQNQQQERNQQQNQQDEQNQQQNQQQGQNQEQNQQQEQNQPQSQQQEQNQQQDQRQEQGQGQQQERSGQRP